MGAAGENVRFVSAKKLLCLCHKETKARAKSTHFVGNVDEISKVSCVPWLRRRVEKDDPTQNAVCSWRA